MDRLTAIRDQLLLLKRDRSKYIRSQDVMSLYDQVVEQVKQMNEIRKGEDKAENRRKMPWKHLLPALFCKKFAIVFAVYSWPP